MHTNMYVDELFAWLDQIATPSLVWIADMFLNDGRFPQQLLGNVHIKSNFKNFFFFSFFFFLFQIDFGADASKLNLSGLNAVVMQETSQRGKT